MPEGYELQTQAVLSGTICGATLILVLYNGFLGLASRQGIYLSYSLLSVAVLIFQIAFLDSISGLISIAVLNQLLPAATLVATGILGTDFLRRMLEESGRDPWIRTGSAFIFLTYSILLAVSLLRPHWFGPWIYTVTMVPVSFYGLLCIRTLKKGHRPSLALLLGLMVVLVSGIIHHFWNSGSETTIQTGELLSRNALALGSLGGLFFFSIALGMRMRTIWLEGLSARSREQFLKALVEASPFPVLVLGQPLKEPLYWNRAAEDVYDLRPGWDLSNCILKDSVNSEQRIEQNLKNKPGPLSADLDRQLFAVMHRSGRRMQMTISVRTIQFENREAYLHIHVDRTAEMENKKAMEREQIALEKAVAEAEESLGARDDFLAAMSHEIRTPMSGILSAAELLGENLKSAHSEDKTGPDEVEDALSVLSRLQRNAYRLVQILNNILDLAKVQAGRMEPSAHRFRLHSFCENFISELKPMFAQVELQLLYEPEGPDLELQADSSCIRQILDRLAFSFLHSRKQGTVRIQHSLSANVLLIRIRVEAPTAAQQDPLLLQKIHMSDESYRPRTARELSLAVATGLVRVIKGSLTIHGINESSMDLGLAIPVDAVHEVQEAGVGRDEPGIKILLFEDNRDNAVLMKRLMEKRGYKVQLAYTAREGIQKLRQGPADLVLMDLHLPDMDGFEATRTLHREYGQKCPPVAALSASTLERDRKEAREAGMVGFLTKPIQKEQFESLIQELFSQN